MGPEKSISGILILFSLLLSPLFTERTTFLKEHSNYGLLTKYGLQQVIQVL
jgi:hypothetical protein